MKKTSLWLSLAFVLVFAAGVAVGTVTQQRHKPPKDFGAFLAEKLDLNTQQQAKMKAIWSKAMSRDKSGRNLYQELRDQRDAAINALLGSSQMVEYQAIIDTYKDQFNKLRQTRRDAIANAVAETRKILTPKQLELYDQLRPDKSDGWRKPPFDHKPDHGSGSDHHSHKGAREKFDDKSIPKTPEPPVEIQ